MDPPNPNQNLSALIDPQQYVRTREMIKNARVYMDQMEAQNEAGFQAFTYTEQELQRRIREGREAEMLAAQLRAGNAPQQPFFAQQPQVPAWQVPPVPLPTAQQYVPPTSAKIEEVPSVSSGRSSRSGSHSTHQRNDSNGSRRRNRQFHQPEVPQNANISYGQPSNYTNVPVQTTTFISHNFYPEQSQRRQSYYNPQTTVPIPAAPVQQPPPPPVYQQPPPQREAPRQAASASSPTSSRPVPVHNVSGQQPATKRDQTAERHDFVRRTVVALQQHTDEVQAMVLNQISDYINGKPTPNHKIRAWGDELKQVGGSDSRGLLNVVATKLVELRKARRTATSQTHQAQPQPQAEPPPQPHQIPQPQPQPAPTEQPPQPQPQPERPPRPQTINVTANAADNVLSERQIFQNLAETYARVLGEAQVDLRRAGDILSVAYVSARLNQPPENPDIWVQKTLDMFKEHFSVDRLPSVFAHLLQQLKRPIPNIPLPSEPPTTSHSLSSLPEGLAKSPSNAITPIVVQEPNATARPLEDDAAMQTEAPGTIPETRSPQSHEPAPATVTWTQTGGDASHPSTQPSLPIGTIPVNPPYPTTTNLYTTVGPDNAAYQGYQSKEDNQLALVPRRNFYKPIPNQILREFRQPQPSGLTYHQPKASTSTLPAQSSVKIRLPREADRSRLAKDILKQLGKPSGFAPAVPTRREYEERRRAEAEMEVNSIRPPAQQMIAQPQLLLNHDEAPLPPEVVPVSDQVVSSGLYTNHPPATPAGEPPLLEYPDPDPTPNDTDAANQDTHMDIQSPEDSLVPHPPASPRPNLLRDSISPPLVPESISGAEERSAVKDLLPSTSPPSKHRGPPPDAEIIEISDDEAGPNVDAATPTVEPMEVDKETGTGGVISQSFSELSLDGEVAPVAVEAETETDTPREPARRRSSQELITPEDIQSTGRKFPRNQVSVELPPLPDYARRNKGKERAPIEEEYGEDPELRAVADLAFSRLRSTRCLWLGCRATLNSVENLAKHLKTHADETERTSDCFECQWRKCIKSYRTRVKLDRHCMHHAQKVLRCPYEDCEEEFREEGELFNHIKDMHETSDLLPSTNPVPYPGRKLGPLPEQVPSWRVFPVSVVPVPISADRHGQIGRLVARNICGTAKRSDSSRSLRSSRQFDTGKRKLTASEIENMMDEERFGFLSSTDDGNTQFANVPSEAVSSYCRHGLLTLPDNDDRLGVARGSDSRRSEPKGIDGGGGVVRGDTPVKEDVISLEVEVVPDSSEDELLLKPRHPDGR